MGADKKPVNKALREGHSSIYSVKLLPLKLLLLVAFIQLFSHSSYLPIWLMVFSTLVCVYRLIVHVKYESSVSGFKKNLLFVSSLAVFFSHYKFNFTVEMAAAYLFLMTSLKLVEVKSKLDVVIACYTIIFLISVSFLFEQGIGHTIIQFVSLFLCLIVLLRLNLGTDFRFVRLNRAYIRKGLLRSLMISIPIFVVLFLFFPRMSPLWTMPLDVSGSKTGFGSTVGPGDISKLTRSSEVAFRVSFSDEPPINKHLYWRGLVLDEFDGREWKKRPDYSRQRNSLPLANKSIPKDSYKVILEPHYEKWAFALDGSFKSGDNIYSRDMGLFSFGLPAIQATRYMMKFDSSLFDIQSNDDFITLLSSDVARRHSHSKQDLQLPARYLNPRTRNLVSQMLATSKSDYDFLKKILEKFRKEEFFYSLEPPVLGAHFADEFLFDSRLGFCEHYSSVVAYMLRLAGIPSRVVVGYQGGELQSNGEYMIVRQYDAHAWVEAKLDRLGWVRLDPTSMVAPNRILSGGATAFAEESTFMADSLIGALVKSNRFLSWVEASIDEVKFAWQNTVVNYNQDEQSLFVSALLGEFSVLNSMLLLAYLLVIFIVLFALYLFFRNGIVKLSFVEIKYKAWSIFLRRLGYRRNVGETPQQFLLRLGNDAPVWIFKRTQNLTKSLEEECYQNK